MLSFFCPKISALGNQIKLFVQSIHLPLNIFLVLFVHLLFAHLLDSAAVFAPPLVACQAQINFCTIFRSNRSATHGHQLRSKAKYIQLLEKVCLLLIFIRERFKKDEKRKKCLGRTPSHPPIITNFSSSFDLRFTKSAYILKYLTGKGLQKKSL